MSAHREEELAALADGSLAPERRAELEAEVAASPELADELALQQRAVLYARNAAATVDAPATLRARIEAQRQPARRRARPRRLVPVAGLATAAVAVVIAVAVIGGGTSAVSVTAALTPTGLAPNASGNAKLTKTTSGWRVELDASGLPRRENGEFYEAWLRNAAGVLVPIGTFNEGQKVTLWSGVSPLKGFTTLTVTRERADGDQTSSGEKVLVGTVDTGS